MAGRVVRIVPKTFVTFANIPGSPNNPTWFWLARRIDVSQWREITLYVRVHPSSSIVKTSLWAVAPSIQVYADGYTDEDPSVFATTAAAVTGFVAKLGSDSPLSNATTTTTTSLTVVPVAGNAGNLLAVAIYAQQPAAPNTGDIYVSIDMSGKE